jgi:hypothetical protein
MWRRHFGHLETRLCQTEPPQKKTKVCDEKGNLLTQLVATTKGTIKADAMGASSTSRNTKRVRQGDLLATDELGAKVVKYASGSHTARFEVLPKATTLLAYFQKKRPFTHG